MVMSVGGGGNGAELSIPRKISSYYLKNRQSHSFSNPQQFRKNNYNFFMMVINDFFVLLLLVLEYLGGGGKSPFRRVPNHTIISIGPIYKILDEELFKVVMKL